MTIYPYLLHSDVWVFDDERTGLKEEAFVCGMSEMITRMISTTVILNAEHGFIMSFDEIPFGHDVELQWLRADDPDTLMAGNWYRGDIVGQIMEGWLCPALLCYFEAAPKVLYVSADQLPPGVDPIWHVTVDDPGQRHFMGPEDK